MRRGHNGTAVTVAGKVTGMRIQWDRDTMGQGHNGTWDSYTNELVRNGTMTQRNRDTIVLVNNGTETQWD